MKKWMLAALFATAPLYALAGIGGHWAPTFGTETSYLSEKLVGLSMGDKELSARFVREKAVLENGFGFKAWFDLPIIPLNFEASANFQGATYGSSLRYTDPITNKEKKLPLKLDMGFPLLGDVEPLFGVMRLDLSAAWRAFDWSPILIGLQGYVGGGVTWNYATPPLTAQVAQEAFETLLTASLDPEKNAKALTKALEKAYGNPESGVGGHLLAGMRIKVFFASVYLNGKYHFGGLPKGIDGGFTMELGGGFGI